MKSLIVYVPSVLVLVLIALMLHMRTADAGSKLTAERHSPEASAVCPCTK